MTFKLIEMNDNSKTKQQLINDLATMRRQVAHLEELEASRQQRDDALRSSEKRYHKITQCIPDLIWTMDLSGRFTYANSAVERTHGWTVDEFLNLTLQDLVSPPQAAIDVSMIEAERAKMAAPQYDRNSIFTFKSEELRKDGSTFWAEITATGLWSDDGNPLGVIGITRDITERKLMEDQLHSTNERLEAMLSALPELMFRIDRDGCIHECHFSSIDRLYVPPSSFLGKKFSEVLPEEAAQIIMSAVEEAATLGHHQGATYSLPMPKGLSWYELSIAPMGKKKQTGNQFIMLVHDITTRKQLEQELKKSYDELEMRVQKRTEELSQVVKTLREKEQLLAAESQRLNETNTALKVLLQHREKDQHDMEKKVLANTRKLVLPYVEKLQLTPLTPVQAGYADVISTNLQNIVSPFLRNLTATYMDFTPREIDVANLVREGKSAKEIALLLNCSIRSIEFHKDNIRRKLGLTHKKTNLRTYLLSLTKTY